MGPPLQRPLHPRHSGTCRNPEMPALGISLYLWFCLFALSFFRVVLRCRHPHLLWIPACAGMTIKGKSQNRLLVLADTLQDMAALPLLRRRRRWRRRLDGRAFSGSAWGRVLFSNHESFLGLGSFIKERNALHAFGNLSCSCILPSSILTAIIIPIRRRQENQPMPLTRDFRETIQARVQSDRAFRQELLKEGVDCLLSGRLGCRQGGTTRFHQRDGRL